MKLSPATFSDRSTHPRTSISRRLAGTIYRLPGVLGSTLELRRNAPRLTFRRPPLSTRPPVLSISECYCSQVVTTRPGPMTHSLPSQPDSDLGHVSGRCRIVSRATSTREPSASHTGARPGFLGMRGSLGLRLGFCPTPTARARKTALAYVPSCIDRLQSSPACDRRRGSSGPGRRRRSRVDGSGRCWCFSGPGPCCWILGYMLGLADVWCLITSGVDVDVLYA